MELVTRLEVSVNCMTNVRKESCMTWYREPQGTASTLSLTQHVQ